MQYHRAGRLAEAEAQYRRALAVAPAHPEALHLLGLLAHLAEERERPVGFLLAGAAEGAIRYEPDARA